MEKRTKGWAARALRRAMRLSGARRMAVYRPERDANGALAGEAQYVGCVFGLRTDEIDRAQAHIALPGVVLGGATRTYLCALCGCAGSLAAGDWIEDGGRRHEVIDTQTQMGAAVRVFVREGGGEAAGEG